MSSAKRRINSTGRKRIGQESISIEFLDVQPGDPVAVKISISLKSGEFPSDANVVFEAYHRSTTMRFDCGTVGHLVIPDKIHLTDLDHSMSIQFRLKVVDPDVEPGRILGAASRLKAKDEGDVDGRRSFFPIFYRDLRHDVWKVEIEQGSRPALIVNKRISGFTHKLSASPMMQAILLPAALRFVLLELVETSDDGEEDGEQSWKDDWLEYCRSELNVDDDPRELVGEDEKNDWIDDVLMKFCESYAFVQNVRKSEEG
ncbi:hypothetical protein [Thalassospira sp. ER-Se-21-Dark]|uniref:hypothetical protein n=1 Tax=Thalassospira sp. ER-Se-21-Dark TaxID=2585190 RepID=UPI001B31418F|nr:hypothetical protein [Thalassospira sp. ER-Se-21-Dark]MBP3127363.1 hypothetical protein [Thalassospira sp. ER-Se-21-Dark]